MPRPGARHWPACRRARARPHVCGTRPDESQPAVGTGSRGRRLRTGLAAARTTAAAVSSGSSIRWTRGCQGNQSRYLSRDEGTLIADLRAKGLTVWAPSRAGSSALDDLARGAPQWLSPWRLPPFEAHRQATGRPPLRSYSAACERGRVLIRSTIVWPTISCLPIPVYPSMRSFSSFSAVRAMACLSGDTVVSVGVQ